MHIKWRYFKNQLISLVQLARRKHSPYADLVLWQLLVWDGWDITKPSLCDFHLRVQIMKRARIIAFVLGLASSLWADDFTAAPLTSDDVARIKQELANFEKGTVSLTEVTEKGGEQGAHELISYYLSHINDVTVKEKLPISRCFAGFGQYPEAARLANDYVQAYPNDWHGWKILGGANLIMSNYNSAISPLAKATRLGDDGSYAPLAFAALKIDRLDVVSNILSQLFALKEVKSSEVVHLDVVAALIIYSLKTDQQDTFVKALVGVSGKEIMSRDDLPDLVSAGCNRFKGKDIDKIRHELEAAGDSSILSNTNNLPP
jgi:hypothetical protein